MAKQEKWLYFRSVTDEASETQNVNSLTVATMCFPASALLGMYPTSDTSLILQFDPVKLRPTANGNFEGSPDTAALTVTQGKVNEVMNTIVQAISSGNKRSDFIVIADDVVTTDSAVTALTDLTVSSQYISPHITACTAITCKVTDPGTGVHEYYEVVTPMTADDNDVAASLSISLPAECVILDAAIVAVSLAGSNHGLVALEVHSAAIADDAASGGTEIVGEDVAGNLSSPDNDLDISSDAASQASIVMGNLLPVARGTAATFFHVTAKEDMSSMTGTPKVGVYIKWIGRAASVI